MTPIVMSGGSGSRLWPLSRSEHPKQFLPFFGRKSLLQATLKRLPQTVADQVLSPAYVICNQEHRFLVAEQLRDLGNPQAQIILEPVARNTAAAVTVAALLLAKIKPDEVLLVLSADHVIKDMAAFSDALTLAQAEAQRGALVTFGIKPNYPETGYGYIHAQLHDEQVAPVLKFVEKPDLATAQSYLSSGDYFWNSGMFAFRADVFLAEMEKYAPDILTQCERALRDAQSDPDFVRLDENAFKACREDSIDYAVMERTRLAKMVAFDAHWNDVGSWSAIWDESEKDAQGNVTHGDVLVKNAKNSYVHATKRLVSVVDVDNLVVVETADAVLVVNKNSTQSVKKIVDALKIQERPEIHRHQLVYRPWGSYESVSQGPHFQVKRLIVKPGCRLSVQFHHHRSEHWVVISGTAKILVGEQYLTLSENQSTFIPVGVVHSLENPGNTNLEVIEVQSGSYLGEDDIVRIEDHYGRV